MSGRLSADSLRNGLLSYEDPVANIRISPQQRVSECLRYFKNNFDKDIPLAICCKDGCYLIPALLAGLLGGYTILPLEATSSQFVLQRNLNLVPLQGIVTDMELLDVALAANVRLHAANDIFRGEHTKAVWPDSIKINKIPFIFPSTAVWDKRAYMLSAEEVLQYGEGVIGLAGWDERSVVTCLFRGDTLDLIRQLIPTLMATGKVNILCAGEGWSGREMIKSLRGSSSLFGDQQLILDLEAALRQQGDMVGPVNIITFNLPNVFFHSREVAALYLKSPGLSGFLNVFCEASTSLAFSYTRHSPEGVAFNLSNLNLGLAFPGGSMDITNSAGRLLPNLVVGNLHFPFQEAVGGPLSPDWKGRKLLNGTIEVIQGSDRLGFSNGHILDILRLEYFLNESKGVRQAVVIQDLAISGHYATKIFVALNPGLTLKGFVNYLDDHISCTISSKWQFYQVANFIPDDKGAIDRKFLKGLAIIDVHVMDRVSTYLRDMENIARFHLQLKVNKMRERRLHIGSKKEELANEVFFGYDHSGPKKDFSLRGVAPWLTDVKPSPAYSVGADFSFDDISMTLGDYLRQTMERFPGKGMQFIGTNTHKFITYTQLFEGANKILSGLYKNGLKPGDFVILQISDMEAYFYAFWACILGKLKSITISLAREYKENNSVVAKIINTATLLKNAYIVASPEVMRPLRNIIVSTGCPCAGILDVDCLGIDDSLMELPKATYNDILFLQLTSGSTGLPKVIQETHLGVIAQVLMAAQMNEDRASDIVYNWLPMDYVTSVVMHHFRSVIVGCTQIQSTPEYIMSDPANWLRVMAAYKVTITGAPNFAYTRLADAIHSNLEELQTLDYSLIRKFMCAGEPIIFSTVRKCLKQLSLLGIPESTFQPAYGMAELAAAVVYKNGFAMDRHVKFVQNGAIGEPLVVQEPGKGVPFFCEGMPMPGVQIRILDTRDELVQEQVIGRLQVKGAIVTPGYLNNDQENRKVFQDGDWFETGDLAFIAEGEVYIAGREKEMIIINGVNYYCHEIEGHLNTLENIKNVGCCSVSEPNKSTESLIIFFTPINDDKEWLLNTIKSIRLTLSTNMGISTDYIVPVSDDQFPKTTSGKIQRSRFKKAFQDKAFRDTVKKVDLLVENDNTMPDWFSRRVWKRKNGDKQVRGNGLYIVIDRRSALGESLTLRLKESGNQVVRVTGGSCFRVFDEQNIEIDISNPVDYLSLLAHCRDVYGVVKGVFHCFNHITFDDTNISMKQIDHTATVYSLLYLVRSLLRVEIGNPSVFVISRFLQKINENEVVNPFLGTLPGLVRSIKHEVVDFQVKIVDFAEQPLNIISDNLLQEMGYRNDTDEVAYRNGNRYIPYLEEISVENTVDEGFLTEDDGLYLVSGALGGIGAELCRMLITNSNAAFLLIGRSELEQQSSGIRRQVFSELSAMGEKVYYRAVDVSDAEGLSKAVTEAVAESGKELKGIFHLAGVNDSLAGDHWRDIDYHLIEHMEAEQLEERYVSKVDGTINLYNLLPDRPDVFFISYSSFYSIFGGYSFGAYASANSFLDQFNLFLDSKKIRHLCLNWCPWKELGMNSNNQTGEIASLKGFHEIGAMEGNISLLLAYWSGNSQLIVGLNHTNEFIRPYLYKQLFAEQSLVIALECNHSDRNSAEKMLEKKMTDSGLAIKYSIQYFDAFPRLSNGNVDYGELSSNIERFAHVRQSGDPVDSTLAQIIKALLGMDNLTANDNFFVIGGSSLRAIQLKARIEKEMGISISVAEIFRHPVIGDLQKLISERNSKGGDQITMAPKQESYPVSIAQRRLWVLCQLEEGNVAYNIPGAFLLKGDLNRDALEKTLHALVERHEILRTVFRENDHGEVRQYIREIGDQSIEIEVQDIRLSASSDNIRDLIDRQFKQPMDLKNGALFKVTLLKVADDECVLIYVIHHIISDGWSMNILFEEWREFYNAFSSDGKYVVKPLKLQYKDYAHRQSQVYPGSLREHKAYWLEQLDGKLPVLDLPTDKARPALKTYAGRTLTKVIDKRLTEEIRDLCRMSDSSLFMGLLGVVNVLLYRYTGQEDIIVGSPIAGREQTGLEDQVGFYVNMVPFRTRFKGEDSFSSLLKEVKRITLQAFEHQEYPVAELMNELKVERDMSRGLLFDVMVAFRQQEQANDRLKVHGLRLFPFDEVVSANSKFDLTWDFTEMPDEIRISIEFSTDLFEQSTIDRLGDHLMQLLAAIVRQPDLAIGELDIMGVEERRLLTTGFNETYRNYLPGRTIVDLMEEQAVRSPRHVALIAGEVIFDYEKLNQQANRLAAWLRDKFDVKPEDMIGLKLGRSADLVVAVLGILKSGAAYVPIDPEYPEERIAYICNDIQCKVLIDELAYENFIDVQSDYPPTNLPRMHQPADLAYVIYTSGSTGVPKGVMICHESVYTFINWCMESFDAGCFELLYGVTSICFDLSVFELFYPLCVGKTLKLLPNALSIPDHLKYDSKVMLNTVPSVVGGLLESGVDLSAITVLNMAGEPIPAGYIEKLPLRDMEVRNLYGPTEDTTYSTAYRITRPVSPIPIGRPVAETQVYILGENLELLLMGVIGEICIGGKGLARGYLHSPDTSAMKFVDHPFKPGSRLYRTGDLGRWLADGTIALTGRKDNQVKLRGYRIELGEIEHMLMKIPIIEESVVLVKETIEGSKTLVAFVVARQPLDAGEISAALGKQLPQYMIPTLFIQLAVMPLMLNGKTDKRALLEMDVRKMATGSSYVAPADELEVRLTSLWSDVLNIPMEGISANDSFFVLGGDSLKIQDMAYRIRKEFNTEMNIAKAFGLVNIKAQADYIRREPSNNTALTGGHMAALDVLEDTMKLLSDDHVHYRSK